MKQQQIFMNGEKFKLICSWYVYIVYNIWLFLPKQIVSIRLDDANWMKKKVKQNVRHLA